MEVSQSAARRRPTSPSVARRGHERSSKMADEEVDADVRNLTDNLRELGNELLELGVSVQSSGDYCQRFCQTLVQYAGKWKISDDPLPLLEVYTVAIQNYSKARPCLTAECDNVCFVLDRLALSCTELLLCLPDEVPGTLWEQFQDCVQAAHKVLSEYGNPELQMLAVLAQEGRVWKSSVLDSIFSQQPLEQDKVNEFLAQEGPALLEMRIRHLVKGKRIDQATKLAKVCAEHPEIGTKSIFKQIYLTCLCTASSSDILMEEISAVDCKDALEMICNLESDGEENLALILCTAFLTRQLQQGDVYCAWELTLFWSKLQQRAESSTQTFLECCRQFSMLSKTVYHIFFLIKVIQSEAGETGLSACIELCVRALRMESNESPTVKTSICKTVSCLLPDYLEVRRACQLTEFLLEPTVEAYYAVETLYNQPDQKYDDENGPIPNSLRCELLLVLKTHWPFDPEFWDWKTLKRHCLALMGEEASIVSSIDELNDSDLFDENNESHLEVATKEHMLNGLPKFYSDVIKVQKTSSEEIGMKEKGKFAKGVVSARFKNWQAYMQYCVLCDREFLGHRIIRHAQTHMKEGNYYCPICAKSFKKKEIFVPHVTFHIKQSCKERLASIKPKRRVGRPPKNMSDSNAGKKLAEIDTQEHRPIKRNSLYSEDFVVFSDSDGSDDEGKDKSYKPAVMTTQKVDCTEDHNCPVTICTKTFKYFKNLIAHVKGHGNDEEAKQFLKMQSNKVVCQYCRRRFVSVSHLNEHLQIHCGPKPYVCIQLECNASFGTYSELVGHRKEHVLFKAKCMFQNCGRIFTESYLLYDHEAQHYHTSSYSCKFSNCGNIYYSQSELQNHEVDHVTHACVKIEVEKSSHFETSQLDPNRADRVNQLLQIKMEDEPCSQPDTYQNGFAIDCVASETVESKSTMSEELNALSYSGEQSHLPKDTYFGVTVKSEEETSMSLTHGVLPKTTFKGEDTLTAETKPSEATKAVQMFSCKVAGCNRSYTSSRSVSKHVKATHPEYYETLKKQRNTSKIQRVRNPLKCQNQEDRPNQLCVSNEESLSMTPESTLDAGAIYQQLIPSVLTVENENVSQSRRRKHTHNKRAKWPAIIKGDKFICSRCYREFSNPKSLGGHLSRRAICKPYDKKESSSVVEQKDGQALYKTEKILSPSAFIPQRPEPPCVPDTFLTGETFLQSLEMGDSAASFAAHELFPPTQENNYSSALFDPSKTPQVTGLPGTFETEIIEQAFQPRCGMSTVEDSAANITISQGLTTVCSPGSFVAGEDMSLNAEVPQMLDVTKGSGAYSSCEPLQQTLESNFCSGTSFVGNEIHPQNLESSCEPTIFFTNGTLAEIDSNHNSSHSEDSKTLDISITELLLGLQNLNLEYDEKLYRSGAPCPTSSSGRPTASMNILTHTPMSDCTNSPNIIDPCLTETQTNTSLQADENDKELKVNLIKPFICQEGGCIYSAMTKDALTNHYVKVHQYSKEQIMEMKMYQTRFAPFRCHVPNCQKTFTRNSNLRAHYQSMHQVTREELVKLRIKRAYCRKSEGYYKAVDTVPPMQEIISQPRMNGSQEKQSTEQHKLEPVTAGPNVINSEISLHLHSTQNAKTILYNQGMPQNSSVLLAGLQDCSALPAQLQNDLAQSVMPQEALVPAPGPQDTPLLLAGPQGASLLAVEPHSGLAPSAGLQAVSPLLAWPQDVLLQSARPQNVSPISEGLQDVPLLPTVQQCVTPLPAIPQAILLTEAQGILPLVSGPPNISLLSAGLQDVSIISLGPQVISEVAFKSADGSLIAPGVQDASPVAAGPQGTSVAARPQDASPVAAGLESASPLAPGPQGTVAVGQEGYSPVSAGPLGASPVAAGPVGTSPVAAGPLGTSPVAAGPLGTSPVAAGPLGLSPVAAGTPGPSPVAAGPLGTSPVAAGPQGASPVAAGPLGPSPVAAGHLSASPVAAGPLGASPVAAGPLGASPVAAGPQGASPVAAGPQGASPVAAGPQGASPVAAGPQDPSPVAAGPLGASPVAAGPQDPSPVAAGPQDPSPVAAGPQDPSPVAAGPQDPSPMVAGLQWGSPVATAPQEGYVHEKRRNESSFDQHRPEDVLLHQKDVSVQKRKSENLRQANKDAGTEKLTKMPGERKCRKSITKIRTECDINKFHKPYRCVHKGCSAAFAIQQNLILHYRAVHQSDQHLLHTQIKQETTKNVNVQVSEFRCQLDDCCRIFQGLTDLIKHYSELHNLTLDEMGKILSSTSEEKFHCDQADCVSSFTVFWSFIKHLLIAHGLDVESQQSDMDATCFKCDCEGCDRTYATRSNLLRHIFTKHRELHQSHLMRPRRIITDQENILRTADQDDLSDENSYLGPEEVSENEDIISQSKPRPVSRDCFTSDRKIMKSSEIDGNKSCSSRKVAKYTLKSKAQALAICSNTSLREQYPCMFQNCSSVVTSECSLVKHYRIHHKISNTFVSQFHSHLVTCRKSASMQGKASTEYVINHEEGLVENAVNAAAIQQQTELSETEIFSKKLENDDSFKTAEEFSELFHAKLIDASASACIQTELEETVEMIAESKVTNVNNYQSCKKRSNGHLTISDTEKECMQSKKKRNLIMENAEQLSEVNSVRTLDVKEAAPQHNPCSHKAHHQKPFDFSTFKPMGFEFSFLKFLEESALKQKKKALANKGPSRILTGKRADHGLISSSVVLGDKDSSSASHPVIDDKTLRVPVDHTKQSAADKLSMGRTEHQALTNFATPLSLHVLKNIKIIMDKSHSDCFELAEKQLQHMQPTVVLSRVKVDFNMLAQVKSVKERVAVKST
ncbi:zinc finger protein 292-like [Scyliorhinus canicula]|uniref:zinc finger protein 292-like n=1 Tax=Scyliorhinus canicula TaxID=7830 RepID=UPI0018F5F0A4|nr:zinc finger protein 292-like [Scyliorhinus canicula]